MASIKCGNCRGTHESVQAVKSCYAGRKATATAPASGATYRENQYAGSCALCGATVEPKAGRLLPKDAGQRGYDVLHLVGECPAPAGTVRRVVGPTARDFSAVVGGYYATVSASGRNDYDFWYVKEGRKPGYRFVKRVLGGQSPIRISGGEAIRALQAIIAEGIDKCGNRFADEMEQCRYCRKDLTKYASRQVRCGRTCAGNHGLGADWDRAHASRPDGEE